MDADQLNSFTLDQLHQAKIFLTSPDWSVKIRAAPAAQRRRAQVLMLQVQQVCRAMENAALQDLADQLKANEPTLVAGQSALKTACDGAATVQSVLKAATAFVNVVAKIVPLV